jgi:glucans biosynthesis protein
MFRVVLVAQWPLRATAFLLAGVCAVLGSDSNSPSATVRPEPPFSFDTVRERARQLARKPFQADSAKIPEFLKGLSYDRYQAIRYRPEEDPWFREKLPFTLQFFHPGNIYQDAVLIHLVDGETVTNFGFSPDQFDYGKNRFPEPVPRNLHFAGLRVLYPVNSPRKQDEVAAFVGASYFRIIGARQVFGASARGLAIDTAEPTGEEFPRFTEYWLQKPGQNASSFEFFALLDSPSATGAYRFVLKPGQTTALDVEASLFLRKDIKKLGLAPLTSMFLTGETRTRFIPDFRPEVHDSDGLLIQTRTNDWIWRALFNPEKEHHISQFNGDDLRGFGLMQRARNFQDYQDLNARFDLRPSLWVEPRNSWGPGTVELVEIPTANEWNENIVAYWVPKQKPPVGQELRWTYTLFATTADPSRPPMFRVEATRISPEHDKVPDRFIVDFTGNTLPAPGTNAAITAEVQPTHGDVRNVILERNDVTGGLRAHFDFSHNGGEEAEIRMVLRNGTQAVSEHWVYAIQKR